MKSDRIVLKELRYEYKEIINKIDRLREFRYTFDEYMELGSEMCSLLDIQLRIMESYSEVLLARMTLLRKKVYDEED